MGPRANDFGSTGSILTVFASRSTYLLALVVMRKAWQCSLILLLSCSPEYELLRGPTQGGTSGDGAAGGEEGVAGNPDVGGTGSGGVSTGGSGALGGTGMGAEGGMASAGVCTSHVDCGDSTVCASSQCVACPDTPAACTGPCEHGFEPTFAVYNGCAICECAPVNACSSQADCGAGQECYPGSQCEPGCSEPRCCRGNRCGASGCAGQPIPHCVAAGCAGGAVCLAACDAVSCECDGTSWQCAQSASSAGAPGASCPQACVSP
jgi:hypothetical protein